MGHSTIQYEIITKSTFSSPSAADLELRLYNVLTLHKDCMCTYRKGDVYYMYKLRRQPGESGNEATSMNMSELPHR